MKVLNCQQGTKEWHWARLGIPTASQFGRILTPKTRKLSASADTYMHELVAEWLIGIPHGVDARSMGFVERGRDMEESAVSFYELLRGVTTTKVGMVMRDDGSVACSPDRLVGDDGGLEVKVPSAAVHVGYMLDGLGDYFSQVQGSLMITGRRWWDLLSYHPDLPPVFVRYERDEEYIGALEPALDGFVARLQSARDRVRGMGASPAPGLAREFINALNESAFRHSPENPF